MFSIPSCRCSISLLAGKVSCTSWCSKDWRCPFLDLQEPWPMVNVLRCHRRTRPSAAKTIKKLPQSCYRTQLNYELQSECLRQPLFFLFCCQRHGKSPLKSLKWSRIGQLFVLFISSGDWWLHLRWFIVIALLELSLLVWPDFTFISFHLDLQT